MFKSTNERYCILTNFHFILCKGSSSAPVFSHAVPIAEAVLEDVLPRRLAAHMAGQDTKDLPAFAFEVRSESRPFLLVAGSAQEKLQWTASIAAAIWHSIPASSRAAAGWRHARVLGTLHSAVLSDSVGDLQALLALTPEGRQAMAAAVSDEGGAEGTPAALASLPQEEAQAVDVNGIDADGLTPLLLAASLNKHDAALALLQAGASLLSTTYAGATALHIAAAGAFSSLVHSLIANGADVNAKDDTQRTPLMVLLDAALCSLDMQDAATAAAVASPAAAVAGPTSSLSGHGPTMADALATLEALLQGVAGGTGIDLAATDAHGVPVLHRLARMPSLAPKAVTMLVRAGADVTARAGGNGVAPLHVAMGLGVRHRGKEADQAAFEAACLSNLAPPLEVCAAALLQAGAQPNGRAAVGGWTPLHVVLHGIASAAKAPVALPPSPPAEASSPVSTPSLSAPPTPTAGMASSQTSLPAVVPLSERLALSTSAARSLGRFGARADVKSHDGQDVASCAKHVPSGEQVLQAAVAAGAGFADLAPPDAAQTFEARDVPGFIMGAADFDFTVLDSRGPSKPETRKVQWCGSPPAVYTLPTHRHGEGNSAVWAPHDKLSQCMLCGTEFTFFNRKHHCRSCYRLVCHACSAHVFPFANPAAPAAPRTMGRACDGCFNRLSVDAIAAAKAARERKAAAAAASKEAAERVAQSQAAPAAAGGGGGSGRRELFAGASAPEAGGSGGGPSSGKAAAARGSAAEVQGQLQQTREKLAERGERMSRMEDKAQIMADSATEFESVAKQLADRQKANASWGFW